ncbi:MAG: 4'-phosphopantetheinyl transferase superfamily protein [Pseudomonadota bacterium]
MKIVWEKPPNKLLISRSELHVWKIDLSEINKETRDKFEILSDAELKRLRTFKFEKDRFRYEITHRMKRLILAKYLASNPKDVDFTTGEHGKPAISEVFNHLDLQFNISHSHKLIIMAVTVKDAVGIDVQYHVESISIESLAEIIFSVDEKIFFSSLTQQQEKVKAFYRCWVRKEAYLKAQGLGLAGLSSVSVDINESPIAEWLRISTLSKKETAAWHLFPLAIDDFYTAAAVTRGFQKKILSFDAKCFIVS